MMASYHRTADPQAAAQQAQLANRGLSPGSQGYGTVQQGQLDAEGEAARQAYLASGNEARQNYASAQSYWDQMNQLRQAQAQEGFALRNQPINEIMALLGGSQVNMPQFSPFSRQGISASSPGQYMASNYQNQLASTDAFNKGLFGLAGAAGQVAMMKSDRRLKEDIVPLGPSLAGAPLYLFRYKGRPGLQIGVMSDEVRAIHPDAVAVDAEGFDLVDYGTLSRRH